MPCIQDGTEMTVSTFQQRKTLSGHCSSWTKASIPNRGHVQLCQILLPLPTSMRDALLPGHHIVRAHLQACEIFILELTLKAWRHAEENKRRTLQRNDVSAAIARTDIFDFLVRAGHLPNTHARTHIRAPWIYYSLASATGRNAPLRVMAVRLGILKQTDARLGSAPQLPVQLTDWVAQLSKIVGGSYHYRHTAGPHLHLNHGGPGPAPPHSCILEPDKDGQAGGNSV